MRKRLVLIATTGILLTGCQSEPVGEVIWQRRMPASTYWETECKTVNGKKKCHLEEEAHPELCELQLSLDSGGTMWHPIDCVEMDSYLTGTRYPKDS